MSKPPVVSARAVDCHAHVFCPGHAFSPTALYVPHPSQSGTAREFRTVLKSHGLTHGLLVGAAPYGYDNSCLLEAIRNGDGRFKGIGLIDPELTDRELQGLADGGLIGTRITMLRNGARPFMHPSMPGLLARMKEMGWFLQIQCEHGDLALALPLIGRSGVRLIIDHFGRPDVQAGIDQPGFAELLELGRSGNAIVKLSGPFRSSRQGFPYADVDPFVSAVIDAFTLDRCVWGSDWPFVMLDQRLDYGPTLRCLSRWLPDAEDRQKVLWDTPARWFGFDGNRALADPHRNP